MLRIPKAAPFIAAGLFLAGCFRESGTPSGPRYTGDDTLTVGPSGVRKPRPPRVAFRTHDSLVTLDILGTAYGDENRYWIYRNGKLLEQPVYDGRDSLVYHYAFTDSLHAAGSFAYTVQYGYRLGDLGPKSEAFTYDFPGRSPSGSVSLSIDEAQRVSIRLDLPVRSGAGRARFERKIGAAGAIVPLDTIAIRDPEYVSHRDTGFVPYDTTLYFRATAMDAASETWLAPTGWDSLRVFNRVWNYVPDAYYENTGAGLRASIRNPLMYEGKVRAFYVLYRARGTARGDGAKRDSLPMASSSINLRDTPNDTGTWNYWVEARDPHGRVSPRSAPTAIRLGGTARGPDIWAITVYSSALAIAARPYENATAYILQRTADTASPPVSVDTLDGPATLSNAFTDAPPSDGYWFYRVIAIMGTNRSQPGEWMQSDYFRRQDNFATLPAPILNLGARGVQVEVPYSFQSRSVLYRGSRADGSDSIAVDSLSASDTGKVLSDIPPSGTWYYRAYRYDRPANYAVIINRTARVRVDFTGKAVGPSILALENLGSGIDVNLAFDPEAVAYVIERSPDTSVTWTVIDTMSVFAGARLAYSDHPPRNGHWAYRARTLLRDLSVTDPGPFTATAQPWIYRVTYDNGLTAIVANRGKQVECLLTTSAVYGYYFKRGPSADYAAPVTVDSARVGDDDAKMFDTPAKGVWYYWVERMIPAGTNSGSISRSAPVRVEFTGTPEVMSLSRATGGIGVAYPKPGSGDTVEIWRSLGKPEETAAFILVKSDGYAFSSASWIDPVPAGTPAGFFHYRLALRREGASTGMGPVKSFYFQGD